MESQGGELVSSEAAALRLLAWCQERNWAGWDPYDALNSQLFQALPFLDAKWPRLVLTQALKRAPINLRPLLQVTPSQNPKALGLFLKAALKLGALGLIEHKGICEELANRIAQLRSPENSRWCWGYSFAWQTRTRCVPRGAANLVCTTFVAESLLDYHEATGDALSLSMALSAAKYITEDLFWTKNGAAAFGYPYPESRVPVHNANFLAAALLARLRAYSTDFVEVALQAARYSAGRQQPDGSWVYGEAENWRSIDNFHTGFNLCALGRIGEYLETNEFEPALKRGYEFYLSRFFEVDGAPKYFHDRALPFDVHSAAQSVITLVQLGELGPESNSLVLKVLGWTLENLGDPQGFFYYQKRSWGRIRIPYMRWGQAWMLLALATFIESRTGNRKPGAVEEHKTSIELSGALR